MKDIVFKECDRILDELAKFDQEIADLGIPILDTRLKDFKEAGIVPGSIQGLQKELSGMINVDYDNYKVTGQNLNEYFREVNKNFN